MANPRGKKTYLDQPGGRARQVLDLLYRRGALTAAEVLEALPDVPSYSAARSVLRALESKGLATHSREGAKYVYRPSIPHARRGRSVIRHVVNTFFAGSTLEAMQALVELSGSRLDRKEAEELRELIDRTERKARRGARRGERK